MSLCKAEINDEVVLVRCHVHYRMAQTTVYVYASRKWNLSNVP